MTMDHTDLGDLLDRMGISTEEAARLTGTDPRKFRRWVAGDPSAGPVPGSVSMLLELAAEFSFILARIQKWAGER